MKRLTGICLLLAAASAATGARAAGIEKFPIGTNWPDTDGTHINCHGGCVVPHNGAFYWFGESRTGGHSDGISVYRSSDLYNWENLGFAATHSGERDDENMQDISEGRLLERPKVIHNARTGKWVMWAHWENGKDYGQARVAILEADEITGPYRFISTMRPNGHDSRDQTLFLDTDGNAYHFCSTNMNTDINVVRLSDDFLGCSSDEKLIMKGRRLEATTVCKYGDTYFATFSECKGWDPAPGHSATAVGEMLGDWTEGLNFCVDPDENRSYRSQGAFVFSVESLGYDPKCFIFYGDRWNPNNVGGSTYVWLPMSIRSGYPTVRNLSEGWNLDEVMRDMYRYKRAASINAGGEFLLLERNSDRLLSRTGMVSGFCIKDDDERINSRFIFEATDNPYIWRLRAADSGRYLAVRGNSLIEDPDGTSDNSAWEFVLLPDGYYRVINRAAGLCLSVADNRRYDGSAVGVAAPREGASQAFGVYYDSRRHQDYIEADMYSSAYRIAVAEAIARQDYKPQSSRSEFVAGRPCAVEHYSSARMLTLADGRGATIADMTKSSSQKLTFIPTSADATTYNIVDAEGRYLAKDPESGWMTISGTDIDPKSAEAIFTVEEAAYGYLIRNSASGKLLGSDGVGEGASVYCDKTNSVEPLNQWNFVDFDAVVVPTDEDRFIESLATIDTAFGSILPSQTGEAPFDYATTAYEAMKMALENAVVAKDDYERERADLENAWAVFQAEGIVLPDPERNYLLRHKASGLYAAFSGESSSPLLDGKADDATFFRFIADETNEGAYALLNLAAGLYMGRSTKSGNNWVMAWNEDPAIRQSLWTVAFSPAGGKSFYNLYTRGYIGSDADTDGATLYCNKANTENFAQWEIIDSANAGSNEAYTQATISITSECGAIHIRSDKEEVNARLYDTTGRLVTTGRGQDLRLNAGRGLFIIHVSSPSSSISRKFAL